MKTIKIGLVGVGMFGGDVHLRTYIQLQQNGISSYLGRVGEEIRRFMIDRCRKRGS